MFFYETSLAHLNVIKRAFGEVLDSSDIILSLGINTFTQHFHTYMLSSVAMPISSTTLTARLLLLK